MMKTFIRRGCVTPVTSTGHTAVNIGSMLHGSEIWPVKKENQVALQQAEMRMVRWMCGLKLQDRIPSNGLRERVALDPDAVWDSE